MKAIKHFIGGFLLCLAEIIAGILLLIDPAMFTSAIIVTCGAAMLLFGIGRTVRYFRTPAEEASAGHDLFSGLLLLLPGIACTFFADRIAAAFPTPAFLYGIVLLITGMSMVQWCADQIRLKQGRWVSAAVSCAASFLCAALIFLDPFPSADGLWMFTGIALILDAFLNIVAFLLSGSRSEKSKSV